MSEHQLRDARTAANMPDQKQLAAMEAKACQFADALLTEGHGLDAPDKAMMTRLLVMRATAKVIARLAKEARIAPAVEIERCAKYFGQSVEMAMRDEGAVMPAGRVI